jgi:hypothetical protein
MDADPFMYGNSRKAMDVYIYTSVNYLASAPASNIPK